MLETILGGIAFLLFIIYDLEQAGYLSHRLHAITRFFFLGGFIFLLIGTGRVVWQQVKLCSHWDWSMLVGLPLTVLFLLLLFYTLFFALPFQDTYMEQNVGAKTYDRGMYALCRHPGVLWFAGLYAALWCTLGGKLLLWLAFFYSLLNLFYVVLQDRYTFPRIFSDYESYQQKVPFLLPNRESLKRCVSTLRKAGD